MVNKNSHPHRAHSPIFSKEKKHAMEGTHRRIPGESVILKKCYFDITIVNNENT